MYAEFCNCNVHYRLSQESFQQGALGSKCPLITFAVSFFLDLSSSFFAFLLFFSGPKVLFNFFWTSCPIVFTGIKVSFEYLFSKLQLP